MSLENYNGAGTCCKTSAPFNIAAGAVICAVYTLQPAGVEVSTKSLGNLRPGKVRRA